MKALLTGRHGSSAKVADGRLVISLPDAETPVLWVMDLDEAGASVIRLELDKQGNSILKKYTNKTAAETVAVYRNRKEAENALIKISKALEKAKDSRLRVGPNSQPVIIRKASLIGRIFTTFLYIWFAVYLCFALLGMAQNYITQNQLNIPTPAATEATAEPTTQPQDLDAAGVPLSADDFLMRNKTPNTLK